MKLHRHLEAAVAMCATLLVAAACGGGQPEPETAVSPPEEPKAEAAPAEAAPAEAEKAAEPPAPARSVTVALESKSGSKLAGKATFTEEGSGVKVVISLEGVKPGDHGAHVHETPDCSAPDAKSAGSHYNPDKHDHGLPDAAAHHIGDLGNIVVGKDGKGSLELTIADANLKADDPHSLLGRAIIVHEKKDDGGQPVGNAGGRIGCGVIKE
jgi:Cu-Zn family superoxide dismutase